jgi:hypothetical protein
MPGRRASRSGSPLCGGPATALRITVRALATVDERRAGLVAIGPLRQSERLDDQEGQMAARIVVGVFESEGIAEDTRNRLKTEGVPASDIVLKVLKEIGPIPSTMEPELEASFLGPVILGNFRESFAQYIRNGETLICVQAPTDERVELAVDTLKQYAPIEVKVVPDAEDLNR